MSRWRWWIPYPLASVDLLYNMWQTRERRSTLICQGSWKWWKSPKPLAKTVAYKCDAALTLHELNWHCECANDCACQHHETASWLHRHSFRVVADVTFFTWQSLHVCWYTAASVCSGGMLDHSDYEVLLETPITYTVSTSTWAVSNTSNGNGSCLNIKRRVDPSCRNFGTIILITVRFLGAANDSH